MNVTTLHTDKTNVKLANPDNLNVSLICYDDTCFQATNVQRLSEPLIKPSDTLLYDHKREILVLRENGIYTSEYLKTKGWDKRATGLYVPNGKTVTLKKHPIGINESMRTYIGPYKLLQLPQDLFMEVSIVEVMNSKNLDTYLVLYENPDFTGERYIALSSEPKQAMLIKGEWDMYKTKSINIPSNVFITLSTPHTSYSFKGPLKLNLQDRGIHTIDSIIADKYDNSVPFLTTSTGDVFILKSASTTRVDVTKQWKELAIPKGYIVTVQTSDQKQTTYGYKDNIQFNPPKTINIIQYRAINVNDVIFFNEDGEAQVFQDVLFKNTTYRLRLTNPTRVHIPQNQHVWISDAHGTGQVITFTGSRVGKSHVAMFPSNSKTMGVEWKYFMITDRQLNEVVIYSDFGYQGQSHIFHHVGYIDNASISSISLDNIRSIEIPKNKTVQLFQRVDKQRSSITFTTSQKEIIFNPISEMMINWITEPQYLLTLETREQILHLTNAQEWKGIEYFDTIKLMQALSFFNEIKSSPLTLSVKDQYIASVFTINSKGERQRQTFIGPTTNAKVELMSLRIDEIVVSNFYDVIKRDLIVTTEQKNGVTYTTSMVNAKLDIPNIDFYNKIMVPYETKAFIYTYNNPTPFVLTTGTYDIPRDSIKTVFTKSTRKDKNGVIAISNVDWLKNDALVPQMYIPLDENCNNVCEFPRSYFLSRDFTEIKSIEVPGGYRVKLIPRDVFEAEIEITGPAKQTLPNIFIIGRLQVEKSITNTPL